MKDRKDQDSSDTLFQFLESLIHPIQPKKCVYKKEQVFIAALHWATILPISEGKKKNLFLSTLIQKLWKFCQLPQLNVSGYPPVSLSLSGKLLQLTLKDANITLENPEEYQNVHVFISQNGEVSYSEKDSGDIIYSPKNPTIAMQSLIASFYLLELDHLFKLKDNLTFDDIFELNKVEKKVEESPKFIVKNGIFNKNLSEVTLSPQASNSNLTNLFCDKRIYNGQEQVIYGLRKSGNIMVTNSHKNIVAWDILSGDILWKFEPSYQLGEKIWVSNNQVVCAGRTFIHLLDLKTGNKIADTPADIAEPYFGMTVHNQQIFAISDKAMEIKSWSTTDLKPTETFKKLNKNGFFNRLLVSDQYIVDITTDEALTIINRENKQTKLVPISDIATALIKDDLLILGTSGIDCDRPDILVMDLKSVKFIDQYRVKIHEKYPNNDNVSKLAANDEYIFMSNQHGEIYCIDLKNKSHRMLENFKYYTSTELFIKDNHLFILADRNSTHDSHIVIWNLENMERVQSIELTAAHKVLWEKGNLFVAYERSWVRYNFNVTHQEKERLLEGSATEPDVALRTGDCLIL